MQPSDVPRTQRVAAYAVVVRNGQVLLAQLSESTPRPGDWTLPGGGVEHGEHPRDAVVREVHEETGLAVEVGPLLDVDSLRVTPDDGSTDYHGIRLVFAGWVSSTADPRVVEVDGSTCASAWVDLDRVVSGQVPVTQLVSLALDWLARYRAASG